MKIYLIRHGQTDWNIAGRIQGSHDIPLNETGLRQAEHLAEAMDTRPVTRIFSSTLVRAKETAEKIGERQKVEVCLMEQLIEVEFGKWEGLTWDEIQKAYPKEYGYWTINPAEAAPPDGERFETIMNRCVQAWNEILEVTNGREDVAIVSHGATLAHLFSHMMRNAPREDHVIVENASITTIVYNPLTEDFVLLDRNDSSHLK
jgi:alpha-ribazole phosphatase/probable phosphoglycerate mutase